MVPTISSFSIKTGRGYFNLCPKDKSDCFTRWLSTGALIVPLELHVVKVKFHLLKFQCKKYLLVIPGIL